MFLSIDKPVIYRYYKSNNRLFTDNNELGGLKMIIFGLDLGNKQTKLFSNKTLSNEENKVEGKVFPSHFLYYDNLGNADTAIFGNKLNISKYKTEFDEEEYAWGPDLHKVHNNENFLDTIGFEKRYSTHEFKLLANFALGELAKDYDAKNNFLTVKVVTGVPSDDFNESSVKDLIKALDGRHTITIDDISYTIDVKEVQVIPQSVGTVYNELLNNQGEINPEKEHYLEEEITVVDIGGGTILIDTLKNMNLATKTQFTTGIYTLYDMIIERAKAKGSEYSSLTAYDVEVILRESDDTNGYFFKPNKNVSLEITQIVQSVRKRYTKELINKINKTKKSTSSTDTMLITGGGANLVEKDEIKKRFEFVLFAENSETANSKGFFKYGMAVMNSEDEEAAATAEE